MIEVNLLPGASRRPARRRSVRLPFSFSALGKLPGLDRWTLAVAGGWIVGPAAIVWLFLGASSRRDELNLRIEQAVQDSSRYATLIAAQEKLRARRDTIAQKLQIIQEIDAGRYIWAHILDEVNRALPDYTWLTRITHMDTGGTLPEFQITGRTGNTFALTRFMKDLEASPFIHAVRLTTTELVKVEGDRLVYQFILLATYEEPSPELVEMVPLFAVEN